MWASLTDCNVVVVVVEKSKLSNSNEIQIT